MEKCSKKTISRAIHKIASVWDRFMFLGKSWWWVGAFCLATAFVYFQAMKRKKSALAEYAFLLDEMEKEKRLVYGEKELLHLKLASQSDPAWIEMILMRDLGVVPEGYLKVHFTK